MHEAPGQRTIDSGYAPREFLVSEDGKMVLPGPNYIDASNAIDGANTGRTDEMRAGLIMARTTSGKKWVPCKRTQANGAGAAATSLIVNDARAFKVGDDVSIVGDLDSIKITDNDNAAATGVPLYLHMDELGENNFGHLESVTAGNADATFTTVSGSVVKVEDDDAAATGGVAIYFDEDGAEGEKLLAAVPTGKDAFIFDTAGRAIRIKYHATPSTPGVLLYFDDDGAAGSKVLFVSPTNADGTVNTDGTVGLQSPVTKASAVNIDSIDYTTNTLTLATAKTWNDNDRVYCDSLAGSEIARGILLQSVRLLNLTDGDTTWRDRECVILAGGFVDGSLLYGDYAACRASSDNQLSKFTWLDRQRP